MTQAANKMRGETSIKLAGHDYVLRPSFAALVAAEEELGPLFAMVERASKGSLTAGEMSALIWHCLPNDTRPEQEVVGEALMQMGLIEASKPVRIIFTQILKGRG